ncbi:MAG: S41 family peptidase [Desulfotalea sp.]
MKQIASVLILIITFSTICLAQGKVEKIHEKDNQYKQLEVLSHAINLIETEYVLDIAFKNLISGAISGMFQELDPHSSYLSPKEYKELQEDTSGSFAGIGVEVMTSEGEIKIISPIGRGPAARAGILAGDKIIQVDDLNISNVSSAKVLNKIKGKIGSTVVLHIKRESLNKPLIFKITREQISTNSVHFSTLQAGLIHSQINMFQETTSKDFVQELKKAKEKGPITGLVLDLRNNPGGLLPQAIQIADIFLTEGDIVSIKTKNDTEKSKFVAHDVNEKNDFPMVVLINNGSASASEIVAAALKENNRAIILGTKSFGKGSVQTIFPLANNNGAIRLTTANYYTPSGKSIQAVGITPDVLVENIVSKNNERSEANLENHLNNPEGHSDKKEQQPDNQLNAALAILKSQLSK